MYQVPKVNLRWPAWFLVPNILCPTIDTQPGNRGEDVISSGGHLSLLRFEISGEEMLSDSTLNGKAWPAGGGGRLLIERPLGQQALHAHPLSCFRTN